MLRHSNRLSGTMKRTSGAGAILRPPSRLKAAHSPGEVVVLSYDDTSAFGLPRFSNRPIKSMTSERVNVVPFNLTNHGVNENFYFYTLKGQYKKGANRLCSTLLHVLRRLKEKDSIDPAERAKTCVARR